MMVLDRLLDCADGLVNARMRRVLVIVQRAGVATPSAVHAALDPNDSEPVVNPVAMELFNMNQLAEDVHSPLSEKKL
jgi:hypothetical protein